MFAKVSTATRCLSAVVLVSAILSGCGSHARDLQSAEPIGDATVRDPDNPYWQGRPLNFDAVDPAQGPGMR